MYRKLYKTFVLFFFFNLSNSYGQEKTAALGIFGSIGLDENTTLSFFTPQIFFYYGEIIAPLTGNSQVYFAPEVKTLEASPFSYSQAPVLYTGTNDFLLPIGDRSAYHPLWLTAVSEGYLRAAFKAEPHEDQFQSPKGLALNPLFHWKVEGDKTAHIQFQWDVYQYNYPWITQAETLRLVGFTGTQWEEIPTFLVAQNPEVSGKTHAAGYRLKTKNRMDFSAYTALTLANEFLENAVEVSEAITPNGDGINDTWHIESITQYPQAHIKVFNRWGTQVFSQTTPYQNDWGGTYKNQSLPNAAYFYQIDLDQNGEVDQQGWMYIN